MKRKWLYIVAALVVVGAIASVGTKQKPTQPMPSQEERAQAHAKKKLQERIDEQLNAGAEIIKVSPAKLAQDYEGNEVAADRDYKGKWLEIEGRFSSVAKDFGGDPYLVFEVGYVKQVQAYLYKFQIATVDQQTKAITAMTADDKAAELKPGQNVVLDCRGAGSTLGMPRLDMCIVVPN